MPARRVTTVTMPVDGRSGVAFEAYRERTPLLTIWAARPGLLVTLTLPEHLNAGHVRFARDLAATAARYATEVERAWRGLPARHRSRYPRDVRDARGPGRCSPHRPGPFPFVPARAPLRKEPVHHDRSARPGHPGRDQRPARSGLRAITRGRAAGRAIASTSARPTCCRGSPPTWTPPRRTRWPPTPGTTSAMLARQRDRQEVTPVKMSAFSGQQLAQVDNPDPFAPPVWRSPVYHTPGWVITIVQLLRALVALVKFLARHPVLDLDARRRGAGLAAGRMARPGHPDRHRDRRARRLAAALARRRSPGSSAPRPGGSGGAGTTSGTGWPC